MPEQWRGFLVTLNPFQWAVTMPLPAAIVLLIGVAAVAWLAARRIVPPTPPGRCAACGYDLRASPTRCPECGRPLNSARPTPFE